MIIRPLCRIVGPDAFANLNYYELIINGHGFTQGLPPGAARAIAARERAMIALMNIMVFAVGREVEVDGSEENGKTSRKLVSEGRKETPLYTLDTPATPSRVGITNIEQTTPVANLSGYSVFHRHV